jgi:hypothetical protein
MPLELIISVPYHREDKLQSLPPVYKPKQLKTQYFITLTQLDFVITDTTHSDEML